MNIAIEQMKKEHICQVAEIEKKSFSMPWSERAFEESMEYEHAHFLVAVDKDIISPKGEYCGIIGYIGMYKVFNEGDITNIAVLPEYRGNGVGRKLMEAMAENARDSGVHDIMLEVRESNEAAISLYKSLGFENAGIRKNFYEKPVENAIVMFLKLLPL